MRILQVKVTNKHLKLGLGRTQQLYTELSAFIQDSNALSVNQTTGHGFRTWLVDKGRAFIRPHVTVVSEDDVIVMSHWRIVLRRVGQRSLMGQFKPLKDHSSDCSAL
jgi:hypothetical protein